MELSILDDHLARERASLIAPRLKSLPAGVAQGIGTGKAMLTEYSEIMAAHWRAVKSVTERKNAARH